MWLQNRIVPSYQEVNLPNVIAIESLCHIGLLPGTVKAKLLTLKGKKKDQIIMGL